MGLNSQTYRLTILQATVLIGGFLLTLFYGCGESGHSVTDTRRAFLSPSDTLSKIAASTQRAAGSNLPVEVGRVSELTHKWKRVRFTKKFTNPVVIAHTSSGSGHDPFVVRIDDVNSSEFDIRVQDWDYLEDIHGTLVAKLPRRRTRKTQRRRCNGFCISSLTPEALRPVEPGFLNSIREKKVIAGFKS